MVRLPTGVRDFNLLWRATIGSRAHSASYSMRSWGPPKEVEGPGCEGDSSLLFSAEMKIEWSYTSTLPNALAAYTMTP
jgi:hypothetical protein